MAYAFQHNTEDRTKTVIAVTVLEAAAIYAVITGLTMTFGAPPPPRILTTREIPTTPPPPTPAPTAAHSPVVQPTVTPTLEPLQPSAAPTSLPTVSATTGPVTSPTTAPTVAPSPQFEAKAPRPRGHPGDWITPNDYPAQDLREGNQGVVRVHLAISATGAATACTVTASSGYPRLDAAACARLIMRARFDPATDTNGEKAAGTFNTSVHWTIPRESAGT
ncbi:MAG: TonB family protein [Novosphingobium sp.]